MQPLSAAATLFKTTTKTAAPSYRHKNSHKTPNKTCGYTGSNKCDGELQVSYCKTEGGGQKKKRLANTKKLISNKFHLNCKLPLSDSYPAGAASMRAITPSVHGGWMSLILCNIRVIPPCLGLLRYYNRTSNEHISDKNFPEYRPGIHNKKGRQHHGSQRSTRHALENNESKYRNYQDD